MMDSTMVGLFTVSVLVSSGNPSVTVLVLYYEARSVSEPHSLI